MRDYFVFVALCLFIILGASVVIYSSITKFSCISSHEEIKFQEGYTSFVLVGKVLVPIDHPAGYHEETVCDKYHE